MWSDFWRRHRGECIGVACGFILGIVYLVSGFWDMLIFAFIVFVGFLIGRRLNRGELSIDFERLWQWLTERWRPFR